MCCKARGFELSYLEKLSQVRDTHTRQPLLYHVCVLLMQRYPQSSDFYSDITSVTKAAKVCSPFVYIISQEHYLEIANTSHNLWKQKLPVQNNGGISYFFFKSFFLHSTTTPKCRTTSHS